MEEQHLEAQHLTFARGDGFATVTLDRPTKRPLAEGLAYDAEVFRREVLTRRLP